LLKLLQLIRALASSDTGHHGIFHVQLNVLLTSFYIYGLTGSRVHTHRLNVVTVYCVYFVMQPKIIRKYFCIVSCFLALNSQRHARQMSDFCNLLFLTSYCYVVGVYGTVPVCRLFVTNVLWLSVGS